MREPIPVFLCRSGHHPGYTRPLDTSGSATADAAGKHRLRAAQSLLRACVSNTGQVCQSIERIYVHRSRFDEFVEALTSGAMAVELNYPNIDHGHIGALIAKEQAEVIRQQVADARD